MPLDGTSDAADALAVQPPARAAATSLGTSYGPGMVSNTVGKLQTLEADKEAAQKPVYDQMKSDMAKDRLRVDKAAENYTPIEPIPAAPKVPENDPLKGFGSVAAIFAGIASAFTHTPAINAMNGMAAAVNGAKKADWEQYDAGYKQWKDNTELAVQHHKLQAEDMKNALEMMQTNLTTGVAMAKAVAASTDDKIATTLLEQGQYETLAKVQLERGRLANEMQSTALRSQELHDKLLLERPLIDATKNLVEAQKSGDPAKIAEAQANYANTKSMMAGVARPGSREAQVDAVQADIRREHPDWTLGQISLEAQKRMSEASIKPGSVNADRSAVESDVKNAHPDWTPGQVALAAKTLTTEATQPVMNDEAATLNAQIALKTGQAPTSMGRSQANVAKFQDAYAREAAKAGLTADQIAANKVKFTGEMSESRALGTTSARIDFGAKELDVALPQALELSDKVYRPGFKKAAEIQQALQGQTSDPDLLEFAQQNQAVMSAYAQVMSRGGVSTVSAMDRAEKLLSTATSQQGYMRQLDRLHKEVQTMLYGTASAKQALSNEVTGRTEEAPQPALSGVPRRSPFAEYPDARQAPDGHWYLQKGGKTYRVDP